MLKKTTALLLLLAALAGGACGDSKSDTESKSDGKVEPLRDRTLKLQYTLKLDGDIEANIDKEMDIRVMTVSASSPQVSISLLSVGPAEPIKIAGDQRLRAAFDLTGYKGDGEYTMQAGSPRDRLAVAEAAKKGEKVGSPNQSNVLIQRWATADVTLQPDIFDNVVTPCPLKVSKDGTEGSLRCEKVMSQTGDKSVSLELRWKRTANTAKSEKTTTTTLPPTTPPSTTATTAA